MSNLTSDLVSRLRYLADQANDGVPWRELRQAADQIDALRSTLERYMFAYPAFRMKPIGAPGSQARIESERLMGLEEQAQRVLAGGKP